MKTLIFKSEQKAKTYKVLAKYDHACYIAGELLRIVHTDDIGQIIHREEIAEEI